MHKRTNTHRFGQCCIWPSFVDGFKFEQTSTDCTSFEQTHKITVLANIASGQVSKMGSNWSPAISLYLEDAIGWLYLGLHTMGEYSYFCGANDFQIFSHHVPGIVSRLCLYLHGWCQGGEHHRHQQGLSKVPEMVVWFPDWHECRLGNLTTEMGTEVKQRMTEFNSEEGHSHNKKTMMLHHPISFDTCVCAFWQGGRQWEVQRWTGWGEVQWPRNTWRCCSCVLSLIEANILCLSEIVHLNFTVTLAENQHFHFFGRWTNNIGKTEEV